MASDSSHGLKWTHPLIKSHRCNVTSFFCSCHYCFKAWFAMSINLPLNITMVSSSFIPRFSNLVVSIWNLETCTKFVPLWILWRISQASLAKSHVATYINWFLLTPLKMSLRAFPLALALHVSSKLQLLFFVLVSFFSASTYIRSDYPSSTVVHVLSSMDLMKAFMRSF